MDSYKADRAVTAFVTGTITTIQGIYDAEGPKGSADTFCKLDNQKYLRHDFGGRAW